VTTRRAVKANLTRLLIHKFLDIIEYIRREHCKHFKHLEPIILIGV